MTHGSVCPRCDFRTELLLLACPRCQEILRHEHCHKCGHCSSTAGVLIKEREGALPHGKDGNA